MEIFKNFGLNPLLLAAQIVNFLVLVFIFKRFFFKKILDYLKAREEKIKEGLDAAQKGEELLIKAKDSQKELLNKARVDANEVLQNMQKRGEEIAQKLKETGQKEAERIIGEAKIRAQEENTRIQQELEKRTLGIAVSVLEKALQNVLTPETHKKIIANITKDFKMPS